MVKDLKQGIFLCHFMLPDCGIISELSVFCQQWPGQLLYNLFAKTRESCSLEWCGDEGGREIDISETRETCLSKMMCPQEQRNTQRMSKWSWYQSLNRQNWLLPGM